MSRAPHFHNCFLQWHIVLTIFGLRSSLPAANRTLCTNAGLNNAKNSKCLLVSKDVNLTNVILKIDGDIIKQTDEWKM